jgi:hypothetical protein
VRLASSSAEKRAFPRVSVKLTAHCQVGTRFVRDQLVDLSERGLYLKTREPVREGAAVRVALALPFEDGPRYCTLGGVVVRVDRDPRGVTTGLGMSFAGVASSALDVLRGFLARATPVSSGIGRGLSSGRE